MNVEQLAAWSQVVASVAVFVSLVFVAMEVRMSTNVARATARHNLSQFARENAQFLADNADRVAKVQALGVNPASLTPGDLQFRAWSQVQIILHAETFYQHDKLGLIPKSHWEAYCRFFAGYCTTPGFADNWRAMRHSFSTDFIAWGDSLIDAAVKPAA